MRLLRRLPEPFVALWGTRLVTRPFVIITNLICQAALVALLAVAVGPNSLHGHADLTSLGLRWPDWLTAIWALVRAVNFIFALGTFLLLKQALGLGGVERPLAPLAALSVRSPLLAIGIGETVEEILYRGIALYLLSEVTGSPVAAAILIILGFGAAHSPLWGPGPAPSTVISGSALMVFFLWHGDLLANILATDATDFVGIVLPPLLAPMRLA